jgi:hypothetical protein
MSAGVRWCKDRALVRRPRSVSGDRAEGELLVAFQVPLRGQGEADFARRGLKKARDRRDEMRKLVADGIDPSAARKQEKLMALDAATNTFEAVAREWFDKHSPNWEASYSVKSL